MDTNKPYTLLDFCNNSAEVCRQKEDLKYISNLCESVCEHILECLEDGKFKINTLNICVLGENSDLDIFEKRWSDKIVHTYNPHTQKTNHIFMASVGKFKIESFMVKKLGICKSYNEKNFRIDFNLDTFRELCCMEVAMMLYKYEEIYMFEIIVAFIRMLFYYFRVYNFELLNREYKVFVKREDFTNIYFDILEKNISDFKPYIDLIDSEMKVYKPRGNYKTKNAVHSKEEISEWITEDMSQADIRDVICAKTGMSKRTAERRMNEWGMTRNYKQGRKRNIKIDFSFID